MILPRRACGLDRHHRPFDSHEGEGQHGLMPQLDVSHMLSAMAHAAGLPAAPAAGWMAAFHYRQGALGPGRNLIIKGIVSGMLAWLVDDADPRYQWQAPAGSAL